MHWWLALAALIFVAAAALMGWGASFIGLHEYGMQRMAGFTYWPAWLIPGTFDGAAFACTLMTYRSSINGRSAVRGRVLMWAFTAVSSWINWIHQPHLEAQLVAAGLPIAAVAVFDVVLIELRADYEAKHGRQAFRLRPGLLILRWMVDREGTKAAFKRQIKSIAVEDLAGLGTPGGRDSVSVPPAAEKRQDPLPPAAEVPESAGEQTVILPSVSESNGERESLAGDRAAARELVRQSPDGWSGRLLGAQFGYSERWGRDQIAAVRRELNGQVERPRLAVVDE